MANGRGHYFQINNSFFCVCVYVCVVCVEDVATWLPGRAPRLITAQPRLKKPSNQKEARDLREKPDCFFFFFILPPSARHFIFPAFRKAAKRSPVFFTSFIFYLLCHSVRPLLLPPSFLSFSLSSLGSHPSQAVFHQTRKWLNFPTTFVIPIVCQLKNEKENLFFSSSWLHDTNSDPHVSGIHPRTSKII